VGAKGPGGDPPEGKKGHWGGRQVPGEDLALQYNRGGRVKGIKEKPHRGNPDESREGDQ